MFERALARSLARGYDVLKKKGGTSVDAVEAAIRFMEDCGLFNAGAVAALDADGRVELDAAIMEGNLTGNGEGTQDPRKKAGAVAAVSHIKNPISAARGVMEMEDGRSVLLVGDGAEHFSLNDANRARYHINEVRDLGKQ
jgi:beta-aspartyl-peptidase (threonine type)